jgi:hypothetical protein
MGIWRTNSVISTSNLGQKSFPGQRSKLKSPFHRNTPLSLMNGMFLAVYMGVYPYAAALLT